MICLGATVPIGKANCTSSIGSPDNLYCAADRYLKDGAKYVQVGAPMSLGGIRMIMSRMMWPSLLGGGKRPFEMIGVANKLDDFNQIAAWMKAGKVRSVIDSVYELEDGPKAYEKLKLGRTRGKIVVHVMGK